MASAHWPAPGRHWPPAPGAITAARVIGWIQFGVASTGALLFVIFAIAIIPGIHDDDDSEFGDWGGLLTLFVAIAIVLGVFAIALMVLLPRLKPGHPGAGTALIVLESIFTVLDLVSLTRFSPPQFVSIIPLCLSVAAIVLLCATSSRRWLRSGTVPGAVQPAQWAADPNGNDQLRYYDGAVWTQWVSNNGSVTAHPM